MIVCNRVMEGESGPNQENLISLLKESLIKQETAKFFGLTESEINDLIDQLSFDKGGISPMFLSPGYGGNDSLKPKILMT